MFANSSADSATTGAARASSGDRSTESADLPDFVLDTFDQWTDAAEPVVAPTVCSCFRS
jgi:hypothetical protein